MVNLLGEFNRTSPPSGLGCDAHEQHNRKENDVGLSVTHLASPPRRPARPRVAGRADLLSPVGRDLAAIWLLAGCNHLNQRDERRGDNIALGNLDRSFGEIGVAASVLCASLTVCVM